MSHNHKFTIIGDPKRCQARCSCKEKSAITDRGGIEEWMFLHNQQVERAKAYLENRSPSLRKTLAWYRQQEANVENSREDRALWKKLADEIEAFAESKKAPPVEQLALW